ATGATGSTGASGITVYVYDQPGPNPRIISVDVTSGAESILWTGSASIPWSLRGLESGSGTLLYTVEFQTPGSTTNNIFAKIDTAPFSSLGPGGAGFADARDVVVAADGTPWVLDIASSPRLYTVNTTGAGSKTLVATLTGLAAPLSMTMAPGGSIYVLDQPGA